MARELVPEFSRVRELCRMGCFEDASFLLGDLYTHKTFKQADCDFSAGFIAGYRAALRDVEQEKRGRRWSPRTP